GVNDDIICTQQGVLQVRYDLDAHLVVKRRARQGNHVDAMQGTRASVIRAMVDHEQRRSWAVPRIVTDPDRQVDALVVRHRNDRDTHQSAAVPAGACAASPPRSSPWSVCGSLLCSSPGAKRTVSTAGPETPSQGSAADPSVQRHTSVPDCSAGYHP